MKSINIIERTTDLALYLTISYIKKGDICIDATAGNGEDTLMLSKACGNTGKVIAMDIQDEALTNTKQLLDSNDINWVTLVKDNFKNMELYLPPNCYPSAIIFNLGYLPGGDKTITSETYDTISAVDKAINLIKKDGIVTITMYPGHQEGEKEKKALLKFSKALDSSIYHVVYLSMHNQSKKAPEILMITRKK